MHREFELGASTTRAGITVALAMPATDGSGRPRTPDLDHFFVRNEQGGWRLINIRDLARRVTLALPIELRHAFFTDAHDDRLHAAARWLARATAAMAAASPQPDAPAVPALWWIEP
jgi:hypothetical protein